VDQHLLERGLGQRIVQPLVVDPLTMFLGPRMLAVPEDPAVTTAT
jgi:hypothetical protein